jgi:hypothetical protein
MLDYEKSISKLIERVAMINSAKWSPTPEANALETLATRLDETIALIDEDTYWDLEEAFNQPSPGAVRFDGTTEPDVDRAGHYASIRWGMYELAEFARRKKEELPHRNKKHALPFAAIGLLHIMYRAGKDRPKLYDNSDAVKELERICKGAGVFLSSESMRGALSASLKSFDPAYLDDGIGDILVFAQ